LERRENRDISLAELDSETAIKLQNESDPVRRRVIRDDAARRRIETNYAAAVADVRFDESEIPTLNKRISTARNIVADRAGQHNDALFSDDAKTKARVPELKKAYDEAVNTLNALTDELKQANVRRGQSVLSISALTARRDADLENLNLSMQDAVTADIDRKNAELRREADRLWEEDEKRERGAAREAERTERERLSREKTRGRITASAKEGLDNIRIESPGVASSVTAIGGIMGGSGNSAVMAQARHNAMVEEIMRDMQQRLAALAINTED